MDWFSGIAGKAENFLNTLDKEAGAAITNVVQSSQNRSSSRRPSVKSENLNLDKSSNFSDSGSVTQWGSEFIDTPEIRSLKSSPSSTSMLSASTSNHNAQLLKKPFGHRRDGSHSSTASRNSRTAFMEDRSRVQNDAHSATGNPLENTMDSESFDGWQKTDFSSVDIENSGDNIVNVDSVQQPSQHSIQSETVNLSENDPGRVGDDSANISAAEALEKELTNLQKRYSDLMKQHKQVQKKAIGQYNQFVANEKALKQLQSSESDLRAMLESRENQIEGFKLKLQQTEIELKEKEAYLENLKSFNEELQGQLEANGGGNRSKEDAEIITNLERELEKCKINFRQEQSEAKKTQDMYREQISRLEDIHQSLVEEIESNKKTLHESKIGNQETKLQLESFQKRFEALELEHSEFKIKAAKTLMDKEEAIRKLQGQRSKVEEVVQQQESNDHSQDQSLVKETEETPAENWNVLKEQCETLVDEVRQLQAKYKDAKDELDKCQNEIIPRHVYEIRSLEDAAKRDSDKIGKLMFEVRTLTESGNRSQLDLEQLRSNLTARIGERDEEIENLRKQLMLKQHQGRSVTIGSSGEASGGALQASQEEWEARLKSLTDSLIQKQSSLEQTISANHSLKVQLERAEGRLRELAQNSGSMNSNDVSIGIYHSPQFTSYMKQRMVVGDDSGLERVGSSRGLLSDYPSDSQVTRRVKRAYNAIDTFSVRAGQFLRRTPGARAVFLVYIVVLHLFVALVLYSYQPEVHG